MIGKKTFSEDLAFGLSKEENVRIILKNFFKDEDDIINTKILYKNDFCKYDYEGTTIKRRYELKSRTNTKNKYPTTIIPVHKITDETTQTELIFVFNFTDKCSYIKYDEVLFKTFNTKMLNIYRSGKYDPPTLHYEIPVRLLIDIN